MSHLDLRCQSWVGGAGMEVPIVVGVAVVGLWRMRRAHSPSAEELAIAPGSSENLLVLARRR